MALAWADLNAHQRRLALERWHREHGSSPGPPRPRSAAHDPLYDPTRTLSGGALKHAVSEVVGAQFEPQLHALDRQAANATTQQTALANRVQGYSGQVDKRATVAQAREQAIAERLGQALDSVGAVANRRADQLEEAERSRLASDRLAGGATGPGSAAVADELAALRARSMADAQTGGTSAAQMSANYGGLLTAERGAQQLHGQELQGQLANRLANDLAEIRAKRSDLQGQRGGAFAKALLDTRQGQFENLVTVRGLGLKESQLQADVAKANAQLKLDQQRQLEAERNSEFNRQNAAQDNARANQALSDAEARDAYQRSHGLGVYRPSSAGQESAQASKLKLGIENYATDFRELLKQPDMHGRPRSFARVVEIIRKRDPSIFPVVELAGSDLAQFGYVRPEHLQSLTVLGVDVPRSWRRPRGAKPDRPAAHGGFDT